MAKTTSKIIALALTGVCASTSANAAGWQLNDFSVAGLGRAYAGGGVVGDVVMDLAVGLQIPFIKNGCPRSGERIDKLNFLMRVKDNYPGCHMAKIDGIVRF